MNAFFRSLRIFLWFFRSSLRRYWRQYVFGAIVVFVLTAFFFSEISFQRQSTMSIGLVGNYTTTTLPETITRKISHGLMQLSPGGVPSPDIVEDWSVDETGKVYTFHLKRGLFWHDGTPVYADNLGLVFPGTHGRIIDSYTIEYTLEEPFAPFLSSLATRPILRGLVGFGPYRVVDSSWAENRFTRVKLQKIDNGDELTYYFYPNIDTAITALKLGEIQVLGTHTPLDFTWENIDTISVPSERRVTALFFRMDNPLLGGDRAQLRQALASAVPRGTTSARPTGPIPPSSWVYAPGKIISENLEIARQQLADIENLPADRTFTLTTLPSHAEYAQKIAEAWRTIGFDVVVDVQRTIPEDFDVLLSDQEVPRIPDQYLLWHSTQEKTNITRYKDERIDKLLEDGRLVLDPDARREIYADFQRFLMQDLPAVFLEYPPYTMYYSKKLDPEVVLEVMREAY